MSTHPSRRSIRLEGYDYAAAGAYFFTICVQGRRLVLGDVVAGALTLWMEGQIVREAWDGLEDRFRTVSTDVIVVMPNHVHGIVLLGAENVSPAADRAVGEAMGAMNRAPTSAAPILKHVDRNGPTLGEVVRVFKAVSTRRIREAGDSTFAWQRNYYERVIRDERELERARAYVEGNPARWAEDRENPLVRG